MATPVTITGCALDEWQPGCLVLESESQITLSGEIIMVHVLALQAIATSSPAFSGIDLLFSSASYVCPTQNPDDKPSTFEME